AALEKPSCFYAGLGVPDELQELARAGILGDAENREAIELGDNVGVGDSSGDRTRRRRSVDRRVCCPRPICPPVHTRALRGAHSRCGRNLERPSRVERLRRETRRRVARLIAEVSWQRERPGLPGFGDLDARADDNLTLEYGQRLVESDHRKVDRRWKRDVD